MRPARTRTVRSTSRDLAVVLAPAYALDVPSAKALPSMSSVSASFAAGLWNDVVRCVARHDAVREIQGAGAGATVRRIPCHTRVYAAGVDTSGVARDGAVRGLSRTLLNLAERGGRHHTLSSQPRGGIPT